MIIRIILFPNTCEDHFNYLGLLSLPLSAWDKYIEHPLASRLASHRPNAHYKALLKTIRIYYTPDALNILVMTYFFV